MKTEFEAKFLDIDIEDIRNRLKATGATLEKPMRLMRRVTIEDDHLRSQNAFVRVRDEGDRVTMTYKQFDSLSVDGAKEFEVTVSDFEEAVALLGAAGLPHRSFQETKRETWHLNGAEVLIDVWPWLNPYIEIESDSPESVKATAALLGLDWNDAVFGDVMTAYRHQYPHLTEKDTVGHVPEVMFDGELPELLKP